MMHWLIFGIVAVLLFGNRLPSVARSLGRSIVEFKKGMSDLESEFKSSVYSEPPIDAARHVQRPHANRPPRASSRRRRKTSARPSKSRRASKSRNSRSRCRTDNLSVHLSLQIDGRYCPSYKPVGCIALTKLRSVDNRSTHQLGCLLANS